MKNCIRIAVLLLLFILPCTGFSQAPEAFSYQSVVRGSAGAVLKDATVSFRISILHNSVSGAAVYVETQSDTTNNFGLVTLAIGGGSVSSGSFSGINWADGTYFLKIEMDETGGSNYALMGVSQLLSVPYAQYAEKTGALGQSSVNYYGTGLTFVSASDTVYKDINGMTHTITVPENCTVLLQSTGTAYGTQFNAWAQVTIGLFIDGALPSPGARQVISIVTDDSKSSGSANWTINYPVALTPGTHTISVKAMGQYQSETGVTIDNRGVYDYSTLTVTFLKN